MSLVYLAGHYQLILMYGQIQNSNNSNLPELQGMLNTNPLNTHTNHKLLLTGKFMKMN